MAIEQSTTDRSAIAPSTEPILPDLSHAKHKPVLHIDAEGDRLGEDDLEIDSATLPVMGSDNNKIP
jgi:hypothetical protein